MGSQTLSLPQEDVHPWNAWAFKPQELPEKAAILSSEKFQVESPGPPLLPDLGGFHGNLMAWVA